MSVCVCLCVCVPSVRCYDPVRSIASTHLPSLDRPAIAMSRPVPVLLHRYDDDVGDDNGDRDDFGVHPKHAAVAYQHHPARYGTTQWEAEGFADGHCWDGSEQRRPPSARSGPPVAI